MGGEEQGRDHKATPLPRGNTSKIAPSQFAFLRIVGNLCRHAVCCALALRWKATGGTTDPRIHGCSEKLKMSSIAARANHEARARDRREGENLEVFCR